MCLPVIVPIVTAIAATVGTAVAAVGSAAAATGAAVGIGGGAAAAAGTAAVAAPIAGGVGVGAGAIGTASLASSLGGVTATAATGLSAAQLFSIGAGLSVIGSFATFIQQSQNAKAQAKFQQQQQDLQTEIVKQDAILSYDALNARVSEERARAGVEIQRVSRESRRAIGVARATGFNVAGAAIDNLIRDFEFKAGEFRTGTEGNLKLTEAQIGREKKGIELRATARGLAARGVPIQTPSFLGAALRAGSGVFDAFALTTVIGPGGTRQFGVA